MDTTYRLTAKGLEKAEQYLRELIAYRKEILDAKLDTADDTPIPTIQDIESDIESFEEDDEYYNSWSIADDTTMNMPLCLKYGEDYLEADIADHPPKIEFIKYTGKWPTLCSGELYFKVNGKEYKIKGLVPGGEVGFKGGYGGESYIKKGPWRLHNHDFPKELKPYKRLITNMVNENVKYGCCGGCL